MKLIIAVVKSFKVGAVRKALVGIGIKGITVTDAKGFGRQKGHVELYRGAEHKVDFLPKGKLEIAVADDMVELAADTILQAAKTSDGKVGDGKIFISNLEKATRIRTGETDNDAL